MMQEMLEINSNSGLVVGAGGRGGGGQWYTNLLLNFFVSFLLSGPGWGGLGMGGLGTGLSYSYPLLADFGLALPFFGGIIHVTAVGEYQLQSS